MSATPSENAFLYRQVSGTLDRAPAIHKLDLATC
ncbi:hypothetical protein EDC50_1818 [Vulcaniibacterium tengchongense]|uniref:Uncharacterized protein n=1 Tax=Vulcaniibacterium tengchongense TaxID=1273429 RepID=A0A3N4VBJ8_9GAMM|nr:hypothetical protein EDC50_1818 [Vulcaniibacterium tengchongense]